jgi:hypothetical protein
VSKRNHSLIRLEIGCGGKRHGLAIIGVSGPAMSNCGRAAQARKSDWKNRVYSLASL